MPETIIHRASVEEVEAAFALVAEYYEAAEVMVREDLAAFRQQYLGEGSGVWLAVEGSSNVGCVAMRRLNGDAAEVKRMYVRPTYRGRGIADLLIQELERYAQERGYTWLYLDTAKEMVAAAKFYNRHGFGTCERYNDNPQAFLFMRKKLPVGI